MATAHVAPPDVVKSPIKNDLILIRDPKNKKIGICSFNGYILLDPIFDDIAWRGDDKDNFLLELKIKEKKAICSLAQLFAMADRNGYGEKNNGPRFGADYFDDIIEHHSAFKSANPNVDVSPDWLLNWQSKLSNLFAGFELGDEFIFPDPLFIRDDVDGRQYVTVKIFKATTKAIAYKAFYPLYFLMSGFPNRPDIKAILEKDLFSKKYNSEYQLIGGTACRLFQQLYFSQDRVTPDIFFFLPKGNMQKAMAEFAGIRCKLVKKNTLLLPFISFDPTKQRHNRLCLIRAYEMDLV